MIKLQYLFEIKEDLLNPWDMMKRLRISEEIKEIKNDAWVDWNNKNYKSGILRILNNPQARLLSKLQLYLNYIINAKNWGNKYSLKNFKNALKEKNITIWRGGGGTYDPYYKYRNFVSFTIDKNRIATFSQYAGTYAQNVWKLPEREHYWVVELTLPLNQILLYEDVGDAEVLVSPAWAKKAKLIKQT